MVEFHFHIHEDVTSDVLSILHRIEHKMTDLSGATADLTTAVSDLTTRLGTTIPALQQALADAQAANELLSANDAADAATIAQAQADIATALQQATDAAASIEANVTTLNSLAAAPPA